VGQRGSENRVDGREGLPRASVLGTCASIDSRHDKLECLRRGASGPAKCGRISRCWLHPVVRGRYINTGLPREIFK